MSPRWTLGEIAVLLAGELRNDAVDRPCSGVATDSRQLQSGELFVALQGEHFDGHDFLATAQQKGALAALVSHPVALDLPQIVVADTLHAYGQLAAAWRRRFSLPLIAVTGSNGKTTVKEMLAAILGQQGPVLATQGNFNNEVGVPRTLLGLEEQHVAAVIEEGASHPGDIAYLTGIVQPTVALVTNAAGAHLQGFGSLQAVAETKGEIFAHLPAGGVAVINADDEFAPLWRQLADGHPVWRFSLDPASDAEVRGELRDDGSLLIHSPAGEVEVRLPLEGRHNAMNALAATAAALAAGAELAEVKTGLEAMRPVPGRLQRKPGVRGATIIDDTYNANPASLQAALAVLARARGERYLALGDMAELGEQAVELHQQAGRQARQAGVQRLYAVGECSRHAAQAFGEHGEHFAAQGELIARLQDDLHDNVTLLVKGSRAAHMEDVVAALSAPVVAGGAG